MQATAATVPPPQSSPARGEEEGFPTNASNVNFNDGNVNATNKSNTSFVRGNAVTGEALRLFNAMTSGLSLPAPRLLP